MIIKNSNNTISFSIFSRFPELLCVMSTRVWGDLNIRKELKNIEPLLNLYKIKVSEFISMEQIHQEKVQIITDADSNGIIQGVDGLVTQQKNLYLSVRIADCVPLFFYDPVKKIIGVAHAGWQGTLNNIAVNMLKNFQNLGSITQNIIVSIGSHIGGCCYTVYGPRLEMFRKLLNINSQGLYFSENKWHLDLGQINKEQLLNTGIKLDSLDCPITCTVCQNNQFFSYSKEGNKQTFGHMLGIIGIRDL